MFLFHVVPRVFVIHGSTPFLFLSGTVPPNRYQHCYWIHIVHIMEYYYYPKQILSLIQVYRDRCIVTATVGATLRST